MDQNHGSFVVHLFTMFLSVTPNFNCRKFRSILFTHWCSGPSRERMTCSYQNKVSHLIGMLKGNYLFFVYRITLYLLVNKTKLKYLVYELSTFMYYIHVHFCIHQIYSLLLTFQIYFIY